MNSEQQQVSSAALGDAFDRVVRQLTGLPDTVVTDMAMERTQDFLGVSEDWTVRTYRQRDVGDTILLTRGSGSVYLRVVIPPKIARIIARQYDALSKKNRRKGAQRAYDSKVAAGVDVAEPLRRARAARAAKRTRAGKGKRS